ncbi:MAG: barstar family protein [Pyrinomonadaceae bacterium]
MVTARLDTESITDWQSFHKVCQAVFGFPDFYGMNMDAWIDCLSYLDKDAGMTHFHLAEGEMLHIEISTTNSFHRRLPEIFGALVECSALVNQRYVEDGRAPVLSLVFL